MLCGGRTADYVVDLAENQRRKIGQGSAGSRCRFSVLMTGLLTGTRADCRRRRAGPDVTTPAGVLPKPRSGRSKRRAFVGQLCYYQAKRSVMRSTVRERTFTEEARRAQIIACAIDVLAELGYAQTSFARIAERAGISKSVISYHFAGKDELLEQVVGSVYAEGARYMRPRIEAERSASLMLAAYVRSNLEFIRDHGKEIAAVTEIAAGVRSREGVPRFAEGPGELDGLAALQAILRRGQADGDFVDFDTRTMAWAVRNLINGVNRQRALDPEFDFDTCIHELSELLGRATRRPDP
jgi:TetR/AcrR family transcriptional regulator, fatty acid metabolism regulator protein